METNEKPETMDYLLLALSWHNPEEIDPPPCLSHLSLSQSSIPSLISIKALQLDHAYCARRHKCPLCDKVCQQPHGVLECSYCPRKYHKDCLIPSMTTVLKGRRWMCPNHPQTMRECIAAPPKVSAREIGALGTHVEKVMMFKDINNHSAIITVGTADGCTLRLDGTRCRRVSSNHAAIYFNKRTQQLKLVNYSGFGSTVIADDFVYILNVRHRSPAAESQECFTMPVLNSSKHLCRCQPQLLQVKHDLSAPVTHGCLLEFGCQIFHFSISSTPMT